jgi:hypothetical protein
MTGPAAQAALDLPRAELCRFSGVLQRGVAVRARAGRSVERFLQDDLALDPRYVAERITTVFLDGQVVDRLGEATLADGALLALSAALPGLVGATLRRSGYYAAMRSTITHRVSLPPATPEAGALVRVKLFNLLIAELGPVLLAHGVVLPRGEAQALLAGLDAVNGLPAGDPVALRLHLG